MAQTRLSYMPQPNEQAYYEGLFNVADTQRTGNIGGQEAVRFFSLSGLPVDVLKPVWTLADQPPTNTLDRPKFAVAVRLIQLIQNGQKGQGPNLAAPEGVFLRPANFEGVSGVSVPLPQDPSSGGQPSPRGHPQLPPQQQQPVSPQQQQQQQQPPPQQQYQAPALTPQQRQQAPTPTPPRPPQPPLPQRPQQPPASSMALTAQDPYTLTPNEQSRYESLFPEYAKPDGFVYGGEAVALFGKSGLPQPQLAAIWNMVDSPVDNRLDKLEFAMAMHLIVCVSKKNLPLPPGLPVALKQLKSQQQGPGSPAHGTPQQHGAPPSPIPSVSSLPPPAMQQQQNMQQPPPPQQTQQPPSPQQMQQQQQMQPPSMMAPSSMSNLQGPPPIQPAGAGADIHDAFEGLSTSDGGAGYLNSQQMSHQVGSSFTGMGMGMGMGDSVRSYASTSPPPIQSHATHASSATHIPEPEPVVATSQAPAPSSFAAPKAPPSPAKTTEQLKSSYDMGQASEELTKLKAVLQKLQAENISLKATMGTLTDEEKDVQKELNATVSEIGRLSNELTTLRAQVLASKSRLLEATAELKACHEKKAVIKDLIAEATATKEALDDAYNGIEQANESHRAQPPAPAPVSSFDGDLFGFDAAPAPASTTPPAPAYSMPAVQQHAQEQEYQMQQQQPQQQPPLPDTSIPKAPSYGALPNVAAEDNYGHHRIDSTGSGYMMGEGIMGGAPTPLPAESGPTFIVSTGGGEGPVPTMESIADLKKKLKEAEDVARDAEESRKQVVAQSDELRRLADEAEAKHRAHAAIPEGGKKKKGLFGGGGAKKKDIKEGERLAQDAKAKKDKLMEVQSQVNDTTAFAAETKAEAERLRNEVEEAEMKLASAASMQQSQHASQHNPAPSQPAPPPPQQMNGGSNGYGLHSGPETSSYGMGAGPMYGMDYPKQNAPSQNEGNGMAAFGGPYEDGGFSSSVMGGGGGYSIPEPVNADENPGVMGGGGMSIPTPSGTSDDPYSNPFTL